MCARLGHIRVIKSLFLALEERTEERKKWLNYGRGNRNHRGQSKEEEWKERERKKREGGAGRDV